MDEEESYGDMEKEWQRQVHFRVGGQIDYDCIQNKWLSQSEGRYG